MGGLIAVGWVERAHASEPGLKGRRDPWVGYETWRGFLKKVVCITLEEGFKRGARLFGVAPVRAIEKLQRRRQENEKGKSGGLINRMTRFKDGKGKQHEQRGSQRGKEKPKTQEKAKQRTSNPQRMLQAVNG